MLKIMAFVFVQDESFDADGVLHLTDLYNKKAVMMIMPRPMQSAEECIKENIEMTLSRIMEDVNRTLKAESTNDIQYFYEKNMIGGMWGRKAKKDETTGIETEKT